MKKNISVAGVLIISSASIAVASDRTFTEVSSRSGITYSATTNTMSGGVAWIDYNSDGWQDILIASQKGANRLYMNKQDGTFANVSLPSGLQLPNQSTQGITIGDFDGDGLQDIFFTNGDQLAATDGNMNTLFRNLGNGTFADVTLQTFVDAAGVPWSSASANIDINDSFGAAFGDLNGDGYLDLYVSNWGMAGTNCINNEIYINQGPDAAGDISFRRLSSNTEGNGCSFQSILTDIDNDHDLDIFVVNDLMGTSSRNEVYRNDTPISGGDPVFTPVGSLLGLNDDITGMGIAAGDVDNDGDLDYYRAIAGNAPLSIQQSDGTFISQNLDPFPADAGKNDGTGWGTAFFDADNDGDIDLYRGNDASGFNSRPQTNYLYTNDGTGNFAAQTFTGLDGRLGGLGLAYADYDKDGDVDIIVNGGQGDVLLFNNDTLQGLSNELNTRHFATLNLKGLAPNTFAVGAKVRISSNNGTTNKIQMREVQAGSSHGSTHAMPVHFGLGDNNLIYNLVVEWPNRCNQTFPVVGLLDQETTLTQSSCISGLVLTTNGSPATGVSIFISNSNGFETTLLTDSNGFYSQTVPIDGGYVTEAQTHPVYGSFATADNSAIFFQISKEKKIRDFVQIAP